MRRNGVCPAARRDNAHGAIKLVLKLDRQAENAERAAALGHIARFDNARRLSLALMSYEGLGLFRARRAAEFSESQVSPDGTFVAHRELLM